MFPLKRAVVIAFLIAGLPSWAHAGPIDLSSPGIVGIVEGKATASNPATEEIMAEFLLWMGTNSSIVVSAATPPANLSVSCNALLSPCEYKTGGNAYAAGDLTFIGKLDGGSPNILPAHQGDNVYIMAKYDGPNAGYILFHLGDWNDNPANTDNVIPQYPGDIFQNKYALSNYNAFRGPNNVPDGGATLALFGGALIGLATLRRRFKA
jgi:hypothetical protein